MSTNENNTETTAQQPQDAAQEPQEPTTPMDAPAEPDEPQDDTRGNKEAAKYRRQARDAEAARDTLSGQLTAARAQIVKASFTGHLGGLTVDALEAGGHPIDSFFGEDGALNVDALTAAGREVADKFGLVQKLIIPNEGKSPTDYKSADKFETAFTPKDRR